MAKQQKSKTPDVSVHVHAMATATTLAGVLEPAFRMWLALNPTFENKDGEIEERHGIRLGDVGTAACLADDDETVIVVENVKFRDVLLAASPVPVPMDLWNHCPEPLRYSNKGYLYDASTLKGRQRGRLHFAR